MFHNLKQLYGRKLGATDGDIGQIKDFYFDDKTWMVRYLVVDTGSWLTGREVLLTPHAFATPSFGPVADEQPLAVNLTRKQIEGSPSIDTHRPVSRQYEEDYYRYYGWPTYWDGFGMGGAAMAPAIVPPPRPESHHHHGHNQRDDLHLRSTKSVAGYSIHASNGEIGSVSGFMLDNKSWAIREIVAETGQWFAGKPILIRSVDVERISYEDSSVFVNHTKETLAGTIKDQVAHAGAS